MDYGLIGDESPTELPEVDNSQQEVALGELKKKAKYSRSKEFADLKLQMEQRIEFYQKYLPTGVLVATLTPEQAGKSWVIATIVIAELQQVIDMYQNAEEELKAVAGNLT